MNRDKELLKRIHESIILNWDDVPEELHAFSVNIDNVCKITKSKEELSN